MHKTQKYLKKNSCSALNSFILSSNLLSIDRKFLTSQVLVKPLLSVSGQLQAAVQTAARASGDVTQSFKQPV